MARGRRGLSQLQETRFALALQLAGPRGLGPAFQRGLGPFGHGLAPPAPYAVGRDVQRRRDRLVRPARALRSRVALEQGAGALDFPQGRTRMRAAALGDPGQPLSFGRRQVQYVFQRHGILHRRD